MDIQSIWGGGVDVKIAASAITAPTGEKLALNPTGDGVRVWYVDPYDSQQKVMDVALAGQRFTASWTEGAYDDIAGLSNVAVGGYDPNTARHNTRAIYAYYGPTSPSSAVTAAGLCINKYINGHVCALPNNQQLAIIWKVRDIIDSLDATAASNSTKKLSNWGFGAASGTFCWSSSEYNNDYAWCVNSSGTALSYRKDNVFGVIPILELDPTTLLPI